jgi:hypothetical protein
MAFGLKDLPTNMHSFYTFLIEQLIPIQTQFEISNGKIKIRANDHIHEEPDFINDFTFNDGDIHFLETLTNSILNEQDVKITDHNEPLIKLWFLITHEYYFKEELIPDKYGRIGIENLKEEFHHILKIPIADVLKKMLQEKLDMKEKQDPKIFLTCDFDILNVWDVWNLKDLARELINSLVKFEFKKGFETIGSFLFSRFLLRFNGLLNERMYCYEAGFINQGYFIASTSNRKYDGIINYDNKLVKKYISRLKSKNVEFGLHTNFDTMLNPDSIRQQMSDFQRIFHSEPLINRHHYLRLKNPDYLKTLESVGIVQDYSLYFPESMIFRAGTSSSFKVWNFEQKRPYNVAVIPTTIMDGTFSDYMNSSFNEAKNLSIEKLNLALRFGDSIVLLWHNRSTYKYANISNNFHPELIEFLIDFLKYKNTD